jgi:uncharacterized protein
VENSPQPYPVIVRTFKYDGGKHRQWNAQVLRRDGSLLVLDAKFHEQIEHPLMGTIAPGTLSIEYYWLDRWYNIFRFLEPTGELRNYYCNVNTPPVLEGNVLSYVDLDIDILVAPDLSFQILDEDEFETNSRRYNYPTEIRDKALQALEELTNLIVEGRFPFVDLT